MPKFSAYMKGGEGIVGPPGASFISGIVATTSQLPENPPENRQIYLVGESDPKHIYAYVDGVWTDQGLTASEVANANATIQSIGWTEDPTVQVSFSTENQKDYFNFDFAVPKTRPAGFGTSSDASATTIAFGATPTVSVSASGEDYEKNFHFNFGIPAGEPAGFGTISATTSQIAYNTAPSVEIVAVTSSPERAKEFNFKFNIPEAYPGRAAIDSLTTNVKSISTRLDSVSTNLNSNYVKKAGDTMTGALSFSTYIDTTLTSRDATSEFSATRLVDVNNNLIGYISSIQTTNSAIWTTLTARNYTTTNAAVTNYIYLKVDKNGTRSVELPNNEVLRQSWRDAIGAVNKAGDTMTGSLYIKNSSMDISANTIPSMRYNGVTIRDANDLTVGEIVTLQRADGSTGTYIFARRKKTADGSNVDNQLVLNSYADGTRTVTLHSPSWLEALGLRDSGWLTLTNSTLFTGTIYYRKIWNIVYISFAAIKLVSSLAGASSREIATIPTGYRPDRRIASNGVIVGVTNILRSFGLLIDNTGVVTICSNKDNDISTSAGLNCTVSYPLA